MVWVFTIVYKFDIGLLSPKPQSTARVGVKDKEIPSQFLKAGNNIKLRDSDFLRTTSASLKRKIIHSGDSAIQTR